MTNIDCLTVKGVTAVAGMHDRIQDVKAALEQCINLREYHSDSIRPVTLNNSIVLRICLLAGLSDKTARTAEDVNGFKLPIDRTPYATTFFTKSRIGDLFEALLKLRYCDVDVNWSQPVNVSKAIGREILRGREILMKEGGIEDWLCHLPSMASGRLAGAIPELNLRIGEYENGMDAMLDINSRAIANTQILVAGTTGSGKSNLLAVLINQIRNNSSDSQYPVNFLLFDYKGEFSDPANASWLDKFDTDSGAILRPVERPLPFTPFKDFTGKHINELNMYATTMATALDAISNVTISAKMEERLTEAIINAYRAKNFKPVTFQEVLDNYILLLPEKKQDDADSVIAALKQLVRANLFAEDDKIDLINDCYIIDLGRFEKDGILAKAIVYFVISKLYNIYESLPKQAVDEKRVELRHFTIIDEAHYMLNFENKPLQNLIAVGRNKGMSIILATQNMESFKSKYFDFYANAQYPLIMKQQQQNDAVLKDLFAVTGAALNELKQAIAGLTIGELITKDATNMALGIGRHWQKIKTTHLI